MDDQKKVAIPAPAPAIPPATASARILRLAAMSLAALVLGGAGVFVYRWLRPSAYVGATEPAVPVIASAAAAPKPLPLCQTWPKDRKPEVVLLFTGQTDGYIKPCGCSKPQYGGVPRRWRFIEQELKARGWPVLPLDLGDVAQQRGAQTKLKYVYYMLALDKMGYPALGVGSNEFALPLQDALAIYSLNHPTPRPLAANLQGLEDAFFGCVKPSYVTSPKESPVKIGVVGLVGPSVGGQIRDPIVKLDKTTDVLPGVIRNMAQKDQPEFLVVLYQGTLEEAKALAAHYPNKFGAILALSREEEPREDPVKVSGSWIINVGHKGRKVGLLGLYRTAAGKPFELHYQLASIGPEYDTPEGQEKGNPMYELLEKYAQDVKDQNFLAQHTRTKHAIQLTPGYTQSTYVGSDKCKKCHPVSYQVWADSPHAHSYKTLMDEKRPSLRQYDPECVVCHVTGLNYAGGFKDETSTPHLKDNGCENCHGPASMHLKNKDDKVLHALMNPFKTPENEAPAAKERRINALDQSCQKCHDVDNDVHWKIDKWKSIAHKEPKGN